MSKWRIILTDGLKEEGKQILTRNADVEDHNGISMEDLVRACLPLQLLLNYVMICRKLRLRLESRHIINFIIKKVLYLLVLDKKRYTNKEMIPG